MLCAQWRRNEFESGEGALIPQFFLFVPLHLFAVLLAVPSAQPFVKVGGHVPPCPMESMPLSRRTSKPCN